MSQSDSLKDALAISPDNIPLLLLYGQALLGEHKAASAKSVYERVLGLNPSNLDGLRGLAQALAETGSISEAIVRLDSIVSRQPDDAESWLLLARLYEQEKSLGEASTAYHRAVTLRPGLRDPNLENRIGAEPTPAPKPSNSTQYLGMTPDGDVHPLHQEEAPPRQTSELIEKSGITFAEVGGMEPTKEEIRMKILYPLKNPDLFRAYGKKIGGGVLLYGPPGCGKTLLSRATAGEIKAGFISVGLHEILDMYIGNSEKNLHEIFELARQNAPCVLFFDEVDAIAADRNDMRKSAGRTLINQFLAELDGTVGVNEGVLVLGATNAPWHIDSAFRRPGRFDRVLFVPPPDESARESVIRIMAQGKPVVDLDATLLAKKTKDFSGADLKAVFDQATERCLAAAMREGRVVPITTRNLVDVANSMKPSTRSWFDSAKNYALYSNQGGFYDNILEFLGIKK